MTNPTAELFQRYLNCRDKLYNGVPIFKTLSYAGEVVGIGIAVFDRPEFLLGAAIYIAGRVANEKVNEWKSRVKSEMEGILSNNPDFFEKGATIGTSIPHP